MLLILFKVISKSIAVLHHVIQCIVKDVSNLMKVIDLQYLVKVPFKVLNQLVLMVTTDCSVQKTRSTQNLFMELALEDPLKYRRCLRMSQELFENLLKKVAPIIQKENTHLRESISAAERLSLTLRHLATGETQESLHLSFPIGQSTISGVIKETVWAIYQVMKEDYLKFPTSIEEWKAVANDAYERWNFPNSLGAMDGKHFLLEHPVKSGSMFHNYQNDFSVALLAVVDAHLRFIFIDVGTNGRASDRGIWNNSAIISYIENTHFPLAPLPNTDVLVPYVIVGDEGFTLSKHVMIPYPKDLLCGRKDRRIFNLQV